jgi:tRNA-splicing ligase RtcB
MKVITSQNHKPIKAWIDHVPVEQSAMQQLRNIASMPFIHHHVAVMPDVHWGMGATVGSVIATQKAIIPAAVGVDIGCGMMACRTPLRADQLPDNLASLRSRIESAVPHGRTNCGGPGDAGAWPSYNRAVAEVWRDLAVDFDKLCDKHPRLKGCNTVTHLGTLGGGNHFIEVCLDEENRVWVMLHSGSRGAGNRIGSYFISLAKEEMKRWFVHLPDADLAYLIEGNEHFDDYCFGVRWAQDFAQENRNLMMDATLAALISEVPIAAELKVTDYAVSCHHNYVSHEKHFGENVIVTRKGAVSAREGELGIIPGAMGRKSYIVRGKGNTDSFHSCSHGAGRAMSRGEAKRTFTVEDHVRETAGVECRKDEGVLDETPLAYKDIDAVMESQKDLVDVVHTLRAVLCVKG